MAFENLFVRSKKSIGGIQLDAVISEAHANPIRLTRNPIELGADITDHSVIEPKKINIVAEVTDTPLGAAALGEIVDLVTGLFGTSTSQNITRSNAAYNALVQLAEEREPIEVQTKLKLYEDMMIVDIKTVQDKFTSRIVSMSIDLEEVIIVESQIVSIPEDQLAQGATRTQATSAENKGRQETTEPNDSTNRSVLKTTLDWLTGD